jgi:hypothetical protein
MDLVPPPVLHKWIVFKKFFNRKLKYSRTLYSTIWSFSVSLFIIYFFSTSFLLKTKSATTAVAAQKTQTPIVAKLTQCEMGARTHTNNDGICVFIKFTLFLYAEISVLSLKENTPFFTLLG